MISRIVNATKRSINLLDRPRLKKYLRRAAIGVGVLLLAWFLFMAGVGLHLTLTARSLLSELQAPQSNLSSILNQSRAVAGDIELIRAGAAPLFPLLRVAQVIPGVGAILGQVEPLLNVANPLAHTGRLLLDVFEPVLSPALAAPGGPTTVEKLFQAIETHPAALDEAALALTQAAAAAEGIHPAAFPEPYRQNLTRLQNLLPLAKASLPALKQLPGLMGGAGRQNFLIVAQNRDELRATGGFITGLGLAVLENGKIASFNLGDSYSVDDFSKPYPTPPAPLNQLMLADYWVTRDANWSPDFPTAAGQIQQLYTLSTGVPTRGVLAFNQLAVRNILEVLGPITLEDYPAPISAATVEDFMRQSWAPAAGERMTKDWWLNRKNFMGDLGKKILSRLLATTDPKMLARLGQVVVDLIKSGHLLVYVDQPEIAALLAQAGLNGALHPGPGDNLYLVDSNIGFNKVDTVVNRTVAYRVDLSHPGSPTAEFTASYQHTIVTPVPCKHEPSYGIGTYTDMQTRCYWNYWRVYLSAGSQLTGGPLPTVPGSMLLNQTDWTGPAQAETGEQGMTVVSGLMLLPTNSRQEYKLSLQLPPGVLQSAPQTPGGWIYTLRLQKQAGLARLPVSVTLLLPPGATPTALPAGWVRQTEQSWAWQGNLTGEQDLSLTFCCTP